MNFINCETIWFHMKKGKIIHYTYVEVTGGRVNGLDKEDYVSKFKLHHKGKESQRSKARLIILGPVRKDTLRCSMLDSFKAERVFI